MKTKITIGTSLKKKPKEKLYKLKAVFDEGVDVVTKSHDKAYILELINTYEDYKKALDTNWNSYCNPSSIVITEFIEKHIADSDEDTVWDIWSEDTEYGTECGYMARFDSYELTYFNEKGIECSCKVT